MSDNTVRQRNVAKKTSKLVEDSDVVKYVVPEVTVKDLLSAIPPHCLERSFWRSMSYVIWDFALLAVLYTTASTFIPMIDADHIALPNPALYKVLRGVAWAAYGFLAGLPGTGLWVIAHECGHQAFSTSKLANNTVGWILHSALSVPYHSWRISHGKHHAQTSHLTGDQVFVPKTRKERGLPPLDAEKENLEGTKVSTDLQEAFMEALDEAPLFSVMWLTAQLLFGWPFYLIFNSTGQRSWPLTNHFIPKAPLFAPHQFMDIIISDIGVVLWASALAYSINTWGFLTVFKIYLMPYLWVNHWLVFITFLQHTDPLLPHYQASSFTFPRGALSTFDRELMGGDGFFGRFCAWIMARAMHGICETHVAHHTCSKMPHYHAWEAKKCLDERLAREGINCEGKPATWSEALRIIRECRFIEDEGEVRFYKNSQGKAAAVAVWANENVSDSGVDVQ